MVHLHATRNVLQRFSAWAQIVFVLRRKCKTAHNVAEARRPKGLRRTETSCKGCLYDLRVHYSVPFIVILFLFFLNKWPGRFPRKILGSKRQMNTVAE